MGVLAGIVTARPLRENEDVRELHVISYLCLYFEDIGLFNICLRL